MLNVSLKWERNISATSDGEVAGEPSGRVRARADGGFLRVRRM